MRKSSVFFTCIGTLLILLGIEVIHAMIAQTLGLRHIQDEAAMVKALSLTDLCLFTEASYTRHLSQADLQTPFQDFPMALEHFPSGSLVPLPRRTDSSLPSDSAAQGIEAGFSFLPESMIVSSSSLSCCASTFLECKTE